MYAWNFTVNAEPETRSAFPGQTVTYTVFVGLVTGPAAVVQLLVSPWTIELQGLSFWFDPSASGTPPFTRTLYATISSGKAPGTYTIPVAGFHPSVGWRTDNVQLVVLPTAPITDWALSNPTMNPSSPKVGDSTTFSAILRALSTNRPYPQSVRVAALLDGIPLGSGMLTYPGPTGVLMTVTLTTPWAATEGHHTILWVADPSPYSYQDPYRYNNEASLSFTVSAAPPPFDFSISASPPTQMVTAGESTSYVIVVTLVSGTGQPVSLSLAGLPSGATRSFNPPSSTPTFQSTLDIYTTKTTKAGTYTLTLTASGGGVTKTAGLTLEIEPAPEEDFSIVVAPTSSEIEQGEVTTHTVSINAIAGFTAAVDLSISGVPEGTTASFSQTKLLPGGTSTLTIKTSRKTPTRAHAITIVASGGGKTHDATVAMTVKEGKPPSILEMLAEYWLMVIGILAALIVALIVFVAFLLRRREEVGRLGVWERHITPFEDQDLEEEALGGVDTTARLLLAPRARGRPSEAICVSCQERIPADATFCPKCGAKQAGT